MGFFDFGLRQVVNYIQNKTTHQVPDHTDPPTPGPIKIDSEDSVSQVASYFNNWSDKDLVLPYREVFYLHKKSKKMLPYKGTPYPVDIKNRTHICMHITAVEFGTTKQSRAKWRKLGQENLSIVVKALSLKSVEEINDTVLDQFALKMALHNRFWTDPYHWVALLNGDILYNNDITRYCYHGDGSNSFSIGCAMEADMPGLEKNRKSSHTKGTEKFILTGRKMLSTVITHARALGAPLEWMTAHRCFAANRQPDPGQLTWSEIVLPICEQFNLKIDYSYKKDDGMQIPVEWDPNGLVTFSGKKLK